MTEAQGAARDAAPGFEVRLGTLLWVALGALFLVMRVAGVVSIPLGGIELDSVSGAWQAAIGESDSRYVPTLFQGLTGLLFQAVDSELWPRVLAVAASCTIPFALYRLRHPLTEPGALIALALLALDAPGILIDSTANVSAFDVPIALWLLVLLRERPVLPPVAAACVAFLVATSGPIPMILAGAALVMGLSSQAYPAPRTVAAVSAGVLAAVLVTSLRFGLGWDGIVVAPFEVLAAGYEREWSTDPARSLLAIYLVPLLLVAVASAAWLAADVHRHALDRRWRLMLLVWLGASFAWLLSSFGEPNPLPLAAVGVPAALIVGPALARGATVVLAADWTWSRYLVPAAIGALLIWLAFAMDWARGGATGPAHEQVAAWGMFLVALGCVALMVSNRASAPCAVLVIAPFLVFPHVAGVSGVAFGGPNEPMPSPISPVQAREIRDIAVTARGDGDGEIVVHSRFGPELAWPFRDSGDITIATQPTLDAVVLVWPTDAPRPEGYAIVEGQWALLRERTGPEGDWLDYLRWYFNRNTLGVGSLPVAVYLRASE